LLGVVTSAVAVFLALFAFLRGFVPQKGSDGRERATAMASDTKDSTPEETHSSR
jgi:hypothetical protein